MKYSLGLLLPSLFVAFTAKATPTTMTLTGSITQSDGTPLEYSNVGFIFQIMDPSGNCVVYREQISGYDMSGSGGEFSIPLGSGTVTYPVTGTFTLADAFSDSTPYTCSGGGTYLPASNDTRILRMDFYDGTSWKTITPDLVIRSAPFASVAGSAEKLGSYHPIDFVLKSDINNPGTGSVSCDSGNFLTWDASAGTFGCAAAAGGGGGTVTSVTASAPFTVTNGTTTPMIGMTPATSSQSGYLTVTDWNTFNTKLGPSSSFSGDISGTSSATSVDKLKGTGLSISSLSSNQVLKYSSGNWVNSTLSISDIPGLSTTLSGFISQSQFPASCTYNQTLTFISPSGSFSCSNILINGSQVSGDIAGNAVGFTGSLAGDVTGNQGTTSVDRIKSVTVSGLTPINGQALMFDGTMWKPSNLPLKLATAGAAGVVPYYTNVNTLDNSNIYYNGNKVGIGTVAPTQTLSVFGSLSLLNGGRIYMGGDSAFFSDSSSYTTAVGSQALDSLSSGMNNTAVGVRSLENLMAGNANVAVGDLAGSSLSSTANNNVIVGSKAGYNQFSGSYNTYIGNGAGSTQNTGDNNILIGYNTSAPNVSGSNQLNIGNLIYGDFTNKNIGIGTPNPIYPLQVSSGNTGATFLNLENTSSNAKWSLGPTGSTNAAGAGKFFIYDATNSGIRLVIDTNGNVGIGGTTAPGQKLDVVGDIRTSGCLYYASASLGTCASDERIKKDVHNFDLGLDALLGIQPVNFKYNGLAGHQDDGKKQLGVIAQQIEKSAPELVERRMVTLHPDDKQKTEIKVVNYGAFTYVLINSVKELYSRLVGTQDDVAVLKTELSDFKQKSDAEISQLKKQNEVLRAAICARDTSYEFCR
jgi:hypothetical protein